jgi:hypothetical protein
MMPPSANFDRWLIRVVVIILAATVVANSIYLMVSGR